jgi:hypothetical protein
MRLLDGHHTRAEPQRAQYLLGNSDAERSVHICRGQLGADGGSIRVLSSQIPHIGCEWIDRASAEWSGHEVRGRDPAGRVDGPGYMFVRHQPAPI